MGTFPNQASAPNLIWTADIQVLPRHSGGLCKMAIVQIKVTQSRLASPASQFQSLVRSLQSPIPRALQLCSETIFLLGSQLSFSQSIRCLTSEPSFCFFSSCHS